MTWFVKANAELERHLSMVAIPKLIKCYDCDKNFHRDELVCDCSTSPMAAYGAAVQAQGLFPSSTMGQKIKKVQDKKTREIK